MSNAAVIFQRDGSILVTTGTGMDVALRDVRKCAQLRSIVAGNQVYDLSPVSLWGACAAGLDARAVIGGLQRWSTMPVPSDLAARIADLMGRYGAIELIDDGDGPTVVARNASILDAIGIAHPADGSSTVQVNPSALARLKLAAIESGWPVIDRRTVASAASSISLSSQLQLRPYQEESLDAFKRGRDGVVLLPCGAGKTLVGVAAAAATGGPVLVLTPSRTVGEQWQAAFRAFTDVGQIGWLGRDSQRFSVATATYHAATFGNASGELVGRHWRLVIYDEVQSLPADVFRLAADIGADRRLGLSATLVREDGREAEVFALVGPVLYEASWLELERDGWIAPARCVEVRVPAANTDVDAWRYKMAVTQRLLELHTDEPTIIVGTDVANLRATGRRLGFPVLTGASSAARRAEVFDAFRSGALPRIGLSRIGSVGVDFPDARVLIQVSGTYGSRQEEAQRLGRILRPSDGKTAHFYTIVASGTREQHFAARRQRYLANHGYMYEIVDAGSIPRASVKQGQPVDDASVNLFGEQ